MVGKEVVAFWYSNFRIGAVIAIASQEKSGNTGTVCLESQMEHAEHNLHVFLEAGRNSRRSIDRRIGTVLEILSTRNAFLDFPHAGKIFIEFRAVFRGKIPLQVPCVLKDEIQN